MKVEEAVIPLVEERAVVRKHPLKTGRVKVRTRTEQREELVQVDLEREDIEVTRVPFHEEVSTVPQVRQEGDVTIVPVVEERLVVEKRLVVVEEIHLRRVRSTETISQPVTLAVQRAEVERQGMSGEDVQPPKPQKPKPK
jgi:uncharacterized protein (TIGR02271 family)